MPAILFLTARLFKFRTAQFLYYHKQSNKSSHKISRVTFNNSIKPLVNLFIDKPSDELYIILGNYLKAFTTILKNKKVDNAIVNPIVFRSIMQFFKIIAPKIQDRFGKNYAVNNFDDVLTPLSNTLKPSIFSKKYRSPINLLDEFSKALNSSFSL